MPAPPRASKTKASRAKSVPRASAPRASAPRAPVPRASIRASKKGLPGLATYEREVRKELEKKIGKGSFPSDIYSDAYMRIVQRAYKSDVHPLAAAGVLVIASGLAPERAPAQGLCCGRA